ncbi:MAG: PTS sugar transporter subunit IIA [Rhodobacteraceae bacterium]|nr:PTS sugar transporter subunit IIA [Paracoccaceae bacterium]
MAPINSILRRQAVCIVESRVRSRVSLFKKIAAVVESAYTGNGDGEPLASAEEIVAALEWRARKFPIGMGQGVLLPAGRLDRLPRIICAFLLLKRPANITVPDHKPVDLVFTTLSPGERQRQDLRIIARMAHILSRTDIRNRLRQAEGTEDIYDIFREAFHH